MSSSPASTWSRIAPASSSRGRPGIRRLADGQGGVGLASSVPTFFPAVDGRYVDGGVGSYANPCYLAAYEAVYCLHWDPAETTLLSFGTGRFPQGLHPGQANKLMAWEWLDPVLGTFGQSADTQQVHLTATMFPGLDFRRFQVDLPREHRHGWGR